MSSTVPPNRTRTVRDLVWSSIFSYALAIVVFVLIVVTLVSMGQLWPVLGYTRVLDWMVRSGVVQLHDGQLGFVTGGVDLLGYWFASQDPVDMGLLLFALVLLVGSWVARGVQFHGITRFCGIASTMGMSLRGHFYGRGVDLFLPYSAGRTATVASLRGQGAPGDRAALAAFVSQLFLGIEIIGFGLIGIVVMGWTIWFQLMAWAAVLVFAAHLLINGRTGLRTPSSARAWSSTKAMTHSLLSQPWTVLRFGSMSALAFGLEVAVIYALGHAFSGPNVVLLIEPPLLMMALVAGYLASWVKVTPGGIGQFELAFAAALYLGGTGIPDTVAVTVLYMAFRYLVGGIILATVNLAYGAGTNLREVTELQRDPGPVSDGVCLPVPAPVSPNSPPGQLL
ncbi:MAG: lysylphosphatidylglycerol synthase domain-containing protein [Actinomycetota bacterium]